MNNIEKYSEIFEKIFDVTKETAKQLKYQDIEAWDSVGHMGLISAIEDAFDIVMDTDDIIDFNSFEKGMEILSKAEYGVDFKK